MIFELIMKSIYFFLPAYCANMAPVLFKKLPFATKSINEKLLGSHKTWRGVIIAPLVGGIVFAIQRYAYIKGYQQWAVIDYADFSLALGFLMGFGAIAGDVVKSYYKRKVGIPPGERWFPLDQLDFVIGGLVFSFFVYVPPAEVAAMLFLISPLLHIVVNYIGYILGINKNKM